MSSLKALYWSARREAWEHRWLLAIPLAIDVLLIIGVLASTPRTTLHLSVTYGFSARVMLLVAAIASIFYCAEALHGDRRDGSILFWKSLPVSDGLVVASKVAVVVVVLPVITAAFILLAQGASYLVAPSEGLLQGPLARPLAATAEVFVSVLAQAPNYAWLLLVSCWARRAVLLWAMVPAVVASVIGEVVTGHDVISEPLFRRGIGRHWPSASELPFAASGDGMVITPARELLASPSLWIGVAIAIVLLWLAIRLRRHQLLAT